MRESTPKDDPVPPGACPFYMFPAFRSDKAHKIEDIEVWNGYVDRLGAATNLDIRSWDGLREALLMRHAELGPDTGFDVISD